jgi:phosphoenolpyruvate phosphomutase
MKTVYVGMAAEILHAGHLVLLEEASKLGRVVVGLLTDEAISSYKEEPVLDFGNRESVLRAIKFVAEVIPQKSLDYSENLRRYKPDFVIHGDDWKSGVQSSVREVVIKELSSWGGTLVEIPYTKGISTSEIKDRIRRSVHNPRVSKLKMQLKTKKDILRFIDLHSALSGLLAENINVERDGRHLSFDGMWASSLTDATSRGKPDIEVVDVSSRILGLQDILEATTKPIIFDGDTGGLPEHFAFTVKSLERNGVSAVIIEDKLGLKKNSLIEREGAFLQEEKADFADKIREGKRAQVSDDFMIIARIESLILNKGVEDALERAGTYIDAGADGIMIHSRMRNGIDFLECAEKFRSEFPKIPLVVVPTSFSHIRDEEFWNLGVDVVIYANHLLRASYPAMKSVAEQILLNGSSGGVESQIMSMKEILSLIPGTN